ncbi:MAG: CcdB family protein [Burkholderiaceae bacterium]|nr:CcdB family protein [Burkholderiaceae bacterium]
MARFDVFRNPDAGERPQTPYLLEVQNDYIDGLDTRVVIPLRTEALFGPRARDLNPLLQVAGDAVVLDTATLGAVPVAALRGPVLRLEAGRNDVLAALDTLFGAY